MRKFRSAAMKNFRPSGARALGILLAGACIPAYVSAAYGQTVQPQPVAASGQDADSMPSNSNASSDDIVVSAQKRSERVQDVAVSISAYGAQQLSQNNITVAVDLVKITPGVNVGGSYGGQSLEFGIRGVVQQDFSAQAESPVALYVDDGYFALGNAAGVGLFDLDHVEVLKGPQGTLFGRNATGGVINIVSRKPTFTPNGYFEIGYESYNDVKVQAAYGGPITSNLAFRVAANVERRDNYIKNIFPGGDNIGGLKRFSGRLHLLFNPTSNLQFLLTGYATRQKSAWGPYYSIATSNVTNSSGFVVNSILLPGQPVLGGMPTAGGSNLINDGVVRDHGNFNNLTGGTLKAEWDFGPTLTYIADYKSASTLTSINTLATTTDQFDSLPRSDVRNMTQELRLQGRSSRFRWFAGVYYLYVHAKVDPLKNALPTFGLVETDNVNEKTNSYSAFAQGEYDLTDKLRFVAGARITREKKVFDYFANFHQFLGAQDGAYPLGPLVGPARGSLHFRSSNLLVPLKAELEFRPVDGTLLYLSWNRGKKAGNFTAPYAASTTFPDSELSYNPETLTAYEIGAKSDLAGGAVRLNAAAFYYDYKDFQAFKAQDISFVVTNNKAREIGGEIDIRLKPTDHLELNLEGSYTDAKVYDVNINGLVYHKRDVPFTSKLKGTAAARYSWDGLGGTFSLRGDVNYTGGFYYGISNFSSTRVPGYYIENARLTWEDREGHWNISAFVNNISDKRYQTVGFDLSGYCGCSIQAYGINRTAGLSIRRTF